ncbi:hypothetical protein N7451_010645 [Penicillium sp. IBT 35674x]|nr:hypothetical protein N7451_010645 [Penicillium sp. IBT 35674x]
MAGRSQLSAASDRDNKNNHNSHLFAPQYQPPEMDINNNNDKFSVAYDPDNQLPRSLLDSGASHHTSPCKELFTDLIPHRKGLIGFGGHTLYSVAIGTMRVPYTVKGKVLFLELRGALLVEGARNTLVSVSKLIEEYPGVKVSFSSDGCRVRFGDCKMRLRLSRGQYVFDLRTDLPLDNGTSAIEHDHHTKERRVSKKRRQDKV